MREVGKNRKSNTGVWWGVGIQAESQVFAGGVRAMVARMSPLGDGVGCMIRITGLQVGPGLGGGGDALLVIATGIKSIGSFPQVTIDSGWDGSLRAAVSFTSTPKAFFRVAQLIRAVPTKDLLNYAVSHPSYVLDLKDAVEDFCTTMNIGTDAMLKQPKLWMFPVTGVGFEASLVYNFHNRVEIVTM